MVIISLRIIILNLVADFS